MVPHSGLHVIANITELMLGDGFTVKNIGKWRYCEEDMRKHLIKCLDNRIMTTFPKIFIGEENNDISTIENNE